MKSKIYPSILTGVLFLISGSIYGQSIGYVQQDVIKVAGISTDAQINALSPGQIATTRQYYDGLGRPLQTVAVQASPLQNDLIQPTAYDNTGRPKAAWLPYAGQSSDITGSYRSTAISTAQPAFYNQTGQTLIPVDGSPYTQQVTENSPLQRLLTAGMTGAGYQPAGSALTGGTGTQHYKTITYRSNNSSDAAILLWGPDGTKQSTGYSNNTLSVTTGTDEENQQTLTYTDIAGRVVLKRQVFSSSVNYDTYYVYNNAGMLIYVIPPKAVSLMVAASNYSLSQTAIAPLIFAYTYDGKGRMSTKKVPGTGAMNIIYDPLNRPVLSQDANLSAANKWSYIKYDVKGRAISSGIYVDATHTSQSSMQSYVDGLSSSYSSAWFESRSTTASTGYYSNNIFPTSSITLLAYTYYDDYDLNNDGNADYSYLSQSLTGELGAAPVASITTGMPTAVNTRSVGNGLSNIWLLKVTFYDNRGRAIQTQSNNQLNYTAGAVTDYRTMVPDFTGKPTVTRVTKVTGSVSANNSDVKTTFGYDNSNRLLTIDQYYNGSGTANHIAAYTYNELGQLTGKKLAPNGSAALQTIALTYNIRGQLLGINDSKLSTGSLFGMQLLYDQGDGNLYNSAGNTPYHNGNLSAVKWMSKDGSGNSSYERSYVYHYDNVNRLTAANYSERTTASTGAFSNNVDGFSENNISYDENGNILYLNRNASTQGTNTHTQIDQLSYTYSGNLLSSVADGGTSAGFAGGSGSYTYDSSGSGNLTADPYKGLSNTFNVLNRVDNTVVTGAGTIYYTYDAGGKLIRKQQYNTSSTLVNTTDYIDEFEYEGTSGGTLLYFAMPEGRILNSAGTLSTEFVISDQQGNARLSFDNSGSGGTAKVRQENSYYAFGMVMPNSPVSLPGNDNKKLYNGGSEWQKDFGNKPDYYQTFYRNYDAAIGRWISVDPEAESAESMTVYQYGGDNPVMMNDPLGNKAKWDFSYQAGGSGSTFGQADFAAGQAADEAFNQIYGNIGGGGSGGGGSSTDYSVFWDGFFASGATNFDTYRAGYDAAKSSGKGGIYTYLDKNGDVTFQPTGNENSSLAIQGDNGYVFHDYVQSSDPTINVIYGGGGIRSTYEARQIYYNGNGSPQALAGNIITDLVTSKEFQLHNNHILSGHTAKTGNFAVNLTSKDFFVGHTNVDYSIRIVDGNAIVTFTMFVNDGYWDPNFVSENTIGNLGVHSSQPDGMGPNLEFSGGHPYAFIPVVGTETFPNPGYH